MTDRLPFDQDAYLRLVRSGCFVCELVAGNPAYPHHVAYRDAHAIVFLARWPWMYGHLLVAPLAHREQVVGDFSVEEYLALQRIVHTAGQALTGMVPTERLYLLSQSRQPTGQPACPLAPGPVGARCPLRAAADRSVVNGCRLPRYTRGSARPARETAG